MRSVTRVFVFGVLSLAAVAAAFPKPAVREREALVRALQSVIDTTPLKGARVSVQVKSLDDGSVVYARDADELLNPASNVKLFTSAAALAKLGPDFRFDTDFLVDADFKAGKDGKAKALYIRGKGDPSLTTERLSGIVSDLAHAGLMDVAGDIVLDESYFDDERSPPGYEQESGDKAYLAPTGAVSFNWNTIGVYVRPGDRAGTPATCELEPASDYFTVDCKVVTGTRTQRRYTVSIGPDAERNRQHIEARGVVPVDKGVWSQWKKVDAPALYFGQTVKALLAQRGVKVKGRVRLGTVPANARLLSTAQSDTLDVVLKRLNKTSSNFTAEQLLKVLGAEVLGAPGTTAKGIDVVEAFLESEVGLARGSYVMKNGSGLNDTNRFSASQTNRLLATMATRFTLMPEYLSSLPIAGKDGTLKYRFEGSEAVWRLRAKTGTLENVSALSGYVQAASGERFVFSVMVNDFPGRASAVVQHIDALTAAVAAFGTPGGPGQAVASMMETPSVVGPAEALQASLKVYAGLAQKAERRHVPFLRTAWRSERDPAVRALIAEALVQSDPKEPSHVRMFLDSVSASDDVYGRLRSASEAAGFNLPVVPTLVELAASGNGDAQGRVLEFVRASVGDAKAWAMMAEQVAVVANDAPVELLTALKAASDAERDATITALVEGFVKAAQPEAPFWQALRTMQGAADAELSAFAKGLETTLAQRIAEAKAPVVPVVEVPKPAVPTGGATAPGG
ncbi:MAG: D-alanyl-D-alanine carboxypeptidase/D-alanyl-D-alanine-endopeptidase [Archangium sp.]|nr:D-alanyl-D-alanine carboxypeptidase/D-alanyl-D-alanine-endopeptidase [Archangium sp.]